MPRKRCCGTVERQPCCRRFSPEGGTTELITVTLEELEAIRLKDYVGLDQMECAEAMQLTRPTFQRLLKSARQKISQALIEGQGLVFAGGHHRLQDSTAFPENEVEMPDCNKMQRGGSAVCPHCGQASEKQIGCCKKAKKPLPLV